MLNEPTIEKLYTMRMAAMAVAWQIYLSSGAKTTDGLETAKAVEKICATLLGRGDK